VPWHFPLHKEASVQGSSAKAERLFERDYPAIHAHLKHFKKDLSARNKAETGIRYEWYALQRWGADYWQEFTRPKVITGRFMNAPTFAYNDAGLYHNNANSFIADGTRFLTGVLNSPVSWWALVQTCTDLQNGYLQAHNENVAQIPIPPATPDQQRLCERLAEALIWLHGPAAKKAKDESLGLMVAYFEQWLNGLVYELFFPDELHTRKLKPFDETAKLDPPDLAKVPDGHKLERLQERFDKAAGRMGAMIEELQKVEVVRIIEEVT
jgi:hypothetical protein